VRPPDVDPVELGALLEACAGNVALVARILCRTRGSVLRAVQDAGLGDRVRAAREAAGTSGPAWRDPGGEAAAAVRAAYERVLRDAGGNLSEAARVVGVSRSCLLGRVRSLGLWPVVDEARAERLAALERALVAAGGDPARAAVLLGVTPAAARARARRAAAPDQAALLELARGAAALGCATPDVLRVDGGPPPPCGACGPCALAARAREVLGDPGDPIRRQPAPARSIDAPTTRPGVAPP
jgi:hypothetical protein